MATIKTQNDKVILKDGKVSCTCCECCSIFDCESLLNYWREEISPEGYDPLNWQLINIFRPSPDTPPQSGWQRDHGILTGEHGSCIRFVCINSKESEDGPILSGQQYCGPTCSSLDLFNLVSSNIGQQTGCFIFAIIFYGWIAYEVGLDGETRRKFRQCSDTAYAVYYAQLTKTNT